MLFDFSSLVWVGFSFLVWSFRVEIIESGMGWAGIRMRTRHTARAGEDSGRRQGNDIQWQC